MMIMKKNKGMIFSSAYTIQPGAILADSIKAEIKNSYYCIVIIDNEVSKSQQMEIRFMKQLKKRIIPVLVSEDIPIPQQLCHLKSITLDEFMKS